MIQKEVERPVVFAALLKGRKADQCAFDTRTWPERFERIRSLLTETYAGYDEVDRGEAKGFEIIDLALKTFDDDVVYYKVDEPGFYTWTRLNGELTSGSLSDLWKTDLPSLRLNDFIFG